MEKAKKRTYRFWLIAVCFALITGCFSFLEVHSVKAAGITATIDTRVKAEKKETDTKSTKNTKKSTKKKKSSEKKQDTEDILYGHEDYERLMKLYYFTGKKPTTAKDKIILEDIRSGEAKKKVALYTLSIDKQNSKKYTSQDIIMDGQNSKTKKKTTAQKKNGNNTNSSKGSQFNNIMKNAAKSVKSSAKTKSTQNTQKKAKNGKTSYKYSWITSGSTGDKNFDGYISKFKVEVGSLVNFLIVIAIIVAGISIRIISVKFAWTKNGAKRSENHEQLITIILVICAILGLGTILALAKQIGEGLF